MGSSLQVWVSWQALDFALGSLGLIVLKIWGPVARSTPIWGELLSWDHHSQEARQNIQAHLLAFQLAKWKSVQLSHISTDVESMDTQANCAVPFYIRDLSILEFWYPSTVWPTRWTWWTPTQRTWVWVSSRSWWRTGKPGMLQPMGLQRVGRDWATELDWMTVFHPILCGFWGTTVLSMAWKLSRCLWDTHFRVQGMERMFRSSEQKNQIK